MSKKSIDELFRQPLEDPADSPSTDLWHRLETRLNEKKYAKKQRRKIRFLQPATVAMTVILLILVAVAVWYFVKKLG
jgi:lipopolysaccharide export LptBFGC system permease protein LptF